MKEIYLIPSGTGGGAEKIFSLLYKSETGTGLRKYITIWSSSYTSLSKTRQPKTVSLRFLHSAIQSRRLLEQLPADDCTIVSILPLALTTAVVAKWLSKRQFKIVYARRNKYEKWSGNWFIEKLFNNWIDGYIFCSNETAFRVTDGRPWTVVNNPIPSEKHRRRCDPNPTDCSLSCCMVGRLVHQKNVLNGILAIADVIKRKRCEITVDVYGEGEEFNNINATLLNAGLANNVKLKGFLANPFIQKCYRVIIHPSRFEGSPNTIYEALAHGLIVVCKRGIEGVSHLPDEIISNHFVFVESECSEQTIDLWSTAIIEAVQRASVVSIKELINRVNKIAESETEFATRFKREVINIALNAADNSR